MGIPTYFAWLARKHPQIVLKKKEVEYDHLYFDFNCLIYHVWNDIYHNKYQTLQKMNKNEIEECLIKHVISYTENIIKMVNPKNNIYISIDGTVPRAKMNQQRLRRFKGTYLNSFHKKINEKYGIIKDNIWDTNNITPGTQFMMKLSDALKQIPRCVISDANEPGEGEHKIMAKIRPLNGNICIYGLDADLIILSLIANKNIHLLREKDDGFIWVDVPFLGKKISEEIEKKCGKKLMYGNVIKDYAFLSFFLGNDFIPCLPSLSIKENGIDFLLNVYAKLVLKHSHAIVFHKNKYIFNNNLFRELIFILAKTEKSNLAFLEDKKNKPIGIPTGMDDREEEIFRNDRLPLNDDFKKYYNFFSVKEMGWKKKYYDTLFPGTKYNFIIVEEYMKAFFFTRDYYFNNYIHWEWHYKFLDAPLISDVLNYINKKSININFIKMVRGKPFRPFEQLLMVLPPWNKKLLPDVMSAGMTDLESDIIEYYPDKFDYHAWGKFMMYSIEPILPEISGDKIREYVYRRMQFLNDDEKQRNTIRF